MSPCPVCSIPVEQEDFYRCAITGCPAYGLRADSVEAEIVASNHYLGIGKRNIDGAVADAYMDRIRILIDVDHRSL